jgi:hypothetical protein
VRWSLGGLVTETEGRAWRTAAEFVIEPGGGHRLEVGAGYGAADTRAPVPGGPTEPGRAAGAVFLRDRWEIGERLATSAAARYTYLGFLPDSHHADAVVEVELRGDEQTVVRGAVSTRTLAPGGDLLTLSTVAASPAIAWARLADGLRPARSLRYEVGIDRALGSARLGAQLFDEAGEDVLLTTFEGSSPLVRNAGGMGVRGFEVSLGQRLGDSVGGSLTYSFGRSRLSGPAPAFGGDPVAAFDDADFHDVVARVDAFLVWSDTRLAALYRLNTLAGRRSAAHPAPRTRAGATTRFDVQLTQGLRFLQPLTRADWELLVAVRNMFYEASQAGFLDELAVQDPPTRVVGGISVRF